MSALEEKAQVPTSSEMATLKRLQGGGSPQREKYWRELGLEEKVERLRFVVKQNINEMRSLRDEISVLQTAAQEHSHNDKGQPVRVIHGAEMLRAQRGYEFRVPVAGPDEDVWI